MPDSQSADFELARAALLEMTPAETIGDPAGSVDEGDGVVTLYFNATMAGYPGWRWTVSIAHPGDGSSSVLETELTPGDEALTAPDWVPWVDRLADYRAAQEAAGASDDVGEDGDLDEELDDDLDDDDDDLDDDDVDDVDDLLHAGDLDGVDIDEDPDDDVAGDLASLEVGVDESDESEPKPDEAREEPALPVRRAQRRKKDQEHDEGGQPEG